MVGQQQCKGTNHLDEVSLFDFFQLLWKQKLFIFLTTLTSLFVGIAYLFLSSPIYEAIGYVSSPSLHDFEALNQGRSNTFRPSLPLYSVPKVYGFFSKNLQAESTKRVFVNEVLSPEVKKIGKAISPHKLARALTVKEVKVPPTPKAPPSSYIIAVKGFTPAQNVKIVQQYIDFAKQKALKEFLASDKTERKSVIRALQNEIDSIREVANNQVLDRIQQLQEAIKIAQAAELKGGPSFSRWVIADSSILSDPSMMYLRGSAALQAELNNLNSRQSSDAFVPKRFKLHETLHKLQFYKDNPILPEQVVMFTQEEITTPTTPIAPHKRLVIILSLVFGVFVGVLGAIIRQAFLNRRP